MIPPGGPALDAAVSQLWSRRSRCGLERRRTQRGLIHRDIKPAKILTQPAGGDGETVDHAYLADFGLMKHQVSRSGLTDTGQFLGASEVACRGSRVAPDRRERLHKPARNKEAVARP